MEDVFKVIVRSKVTPVNGSKDLLNDLYKKLDKNKSNQLNKKEERPFKEFLREACKRLG